MAAQVAPINETTAFGRGCVRRRLRMHRRYERKLARTRASRKAVMRSRAYMRVSATYRPASRAQAPRRCVGGQLPSRSFGASRRWCREARQLRDRSDPSVRGVRIDSHRRPQCGSAALRTTSGSHGSPPLSGEAGRAAGSHALSSLSDSGRIEWRPGAATSWLIWSQSSSAVGDLPAERDQDLDPGRSRFA